MAEITQAPLDPGALLARMRENSRGCGAVVSFTGLVRDRGEHGAVTALFLDAYPGFTDAALAAMEADARARFALNHVWIVHRYGPMLPSDVIVFVAAAAAHRRAAFDAVDFLMDELKLKAPFWKKETSPSGSLWIEPRQSDRADAARWPEALNT